MPIPTPVENLRPARETCEQCHWPAKFSGKKMKVVRRYGEDDASTRLTTVLMMNIGGINPASGKYEGIHRHVSPDVRITYYPKDESRKEIQYVQVEEQGGRREVFVGSKDFVPPKDTPPRVMDCIDCHNRPTHIYEDPSFAVDDALSEKGNTISQDCTLCHTPVAMEEKNPAVLEQLGTQ
jgi:hypothetical protein